MAQRVAEIQQALGEVPGLDGWLFYDFRHSDPLAYRILQLDPQRPLTRRWYYWIPARGTPIKLQHQIEPHALDGLPGKALFYVSWEQQHHQLRRILRPGSRVAMQYSPLNDVPYISRVDAGTIEVIRGCGVEIVSAADLVQQFEAVWDGHQLASHKYAAARLRRIVDETFAYVRQRITAHESPTEYEVQQFILERIRAHRLTTSSPPIVAANAHSADPHYCPPRRGSARIKRGDLILIDLWAKRPTARSVYADMTWTGFVGHEVPAHHRHIFAIVRAARDAAFEFVRSRVSAGQFPCGWEVDEICRAVIREAGYGNRFVHRTGHSIGEEVHGNGANLDNLETRESRRLIPRTCFSLEPGIYLPGQFGIRSELNVYLSERKAHVFGKPIQTDIVPILGHSGASPR
jgi:Xaa-Pro aminopeptidase